MGIVHGIGLSTKTETYGRAMGRRSGRLSPEKHEQIVRLIADHHAVAYGYAYRLSGLEADAEDLVQEAFLLAHQHLDQLRDHSKARPWLLAIVRNCFLKELGRRRPAVESNLDLDLNEVAERSVGLPLTSRDSKRARTGCRRISGLLF